MPPNENVEVKESSIPGAGKGLFARKPFSPGQTVVSVDRPLVVELENERMLDTCAWCCQRGATDPTERRMAASMGLPNGSIDIRTCTGCKKVGYCSRACQSRAWKREHKHECKTIGLKDRPDLPTSIRAVIKLLNRLKADPAGETARVQEILSLWPAGDPGGLQKIAAQDKQKYEDFQMLGRAAWHYCGQPKIDGLDSRTVAMGLLSNIMCNSFVLLSPLDTVNLGIGFDPLICRTNHSCNPNAILVPNQPQEEIRALRPIKAGEEIFIKYVEVSNPFSVRQVELKENHYFTCQCTRCDQGASLEADLFLKSPEDLESKSQELADKLVSRHESNLLTFLPPGSNSKAQRRVAAMEAEANAVLNNEQATLDEIKEAIQMCIGSKLWPWTRQPVPQLCRRLFTLYVESGAIYQAFRLGIKLHCEILPALYPQEFDPNRLINAWTVSTLVNVLCGDAHQELFQELAQGGIELRLLYFGFLFYLHEHTPKTFRSDSAFGSVVEYTYMQIMTGMGIPKAKIEDKVKAAWPSLEALGHNVTISNL
ncbi:SET domain-containing protein [Xylaria palmicola]|nr:SET domain-containing protein [Xylaria palmicola]